MANQKITQLSVATTASNTDLIPIVTGVGSSPVTQSISAQNLFGTMGGASGYSGVQGISGYSGHYGVSGYSGISGISGYSGVSGISGYSGISGTGTSGYSGISGYNNANEVDGSANLSASVAQVSGTIISNYGQAASNVTVTLPTAAAGMNFVGTVGTAQAGNTWKFKAGTNDKIYLDGVAGTDNQSAIVTPAVGNYITFITFKTGSATWDWIARSGNGTWTAGA